MIIFRGLGIIGLLTAGIGVGIGFLLTALTGGDTSGDMNMTFAGIGWIIAGIGTYFLGQYLNVTRPQAEIDKVLAVKRVEFDQLINAGRFHAGPDFPFPRSVEEARDQSNQVLNQIAAVGQQRKNLHTFFFIPLQWFGAVAVVGGLIAMASAIFA